MTEAKEDAKSLHEKLVCRLRILERFYANGTLSPHLQDPEFREVLEKEIQLKRALDAAKRI